MKETKDFISEKRKEENEAVFMSKEDEAIFEKGLDIAYSIIYKTETPCKA